MDTVLCSGISSEEKRGGRGPWNWGSVEEATRLVKCNNKKKGIH